MRRLRHWVRTFAGHFWTVAPPLLNWLFRLGQASRGTPMLVHFRDSAVGPITIRAVHHEVAAATSVVVIVHGIGGNADSPYCLRAARSAMKAGWSAVRVSLRGADGNGDDIYHAGLTDDLRALLASPPLRRYRRVFLAGYSLGGNIVLRAAAERLDARVAGVVAICPPLDLRTVMENFDRLRYRLHKLFMNREANRSYAEVERRGRACSTVTMLQRARNCAEWNELTVVPRFGFRSANDYYETTSAARVWNRLSVPALIAASRYDPMAPAESLERVLAKAPAQVHTAWLECGGHLYFPRSVHLGESSVPGLENQWVAWLMRKGRFTDDAAAAS